MRVEQHMTLIWETWVCIKSSNTSLFAFFYLFNIFLPWWAGFYWGSQALNCVLNETVGCTLWFYSTCKNTSSAPQAWSSLISVVLHTWGGSSLGSLHGIQFVWTLKPRHKMFALLFSPQQIKTCGTVCIWVFWSKRKSLGHGLVMMTGKSQSRATTSRTISISLKLRAQLLSGMKKITCWLSTFHLRPAVQRTPVMITLRCYPADRLPWGEAHPAAGDTALHQQHPSPFTTQRNALTTTWQPSA